MPARTKHLLRDCFLSLRRLKERLNELKQARYPSKSVKPYFILFELLIDRLECSLRLIEEAVLAELAEDYDITLEVFWRFLKSDCPAYLSLIEETNSTRVPIELIRPLEDNVRTVFPAVWLLFRPMEDHNYSHQDILPEVVQKTRGILSRYYESSDFNDLAAEFRSVLGNLNVNHLGIISFPSLDKRAFLQHTIIGHEFGHIVARQKVDGLADHAVTNAEVQNKLQQEFGTAFEQLSEAERQAYTSWCLDRVYKYLRELYCDLVDSRIFGWSAVFAHYQFTLGSEDLDAVPTDHPPDRYRLLWILKYARPASFLSLMSSSTFPSEVKKSIRGKVRELVGIARDIDQFQNVLAQQRWLKVVLDVVEGKLGTMMEDIENSFSGLRPAGNDINLNVISELYSRLLREVTPNLVHEIVEEPEIPGAEVDYRHIMLASWIYRIANLDLLTSRTEFEERFEKADRLSLRGSELNYIFCKSSDFRRRELTRELKVGEERLTEKELGLVAPTEWPPGRDRSVLNRTEIVSRLRKIDDERLDVTPIFSWKQITDGAIDIRLGNEFIVIRRTEFPTLDVGKADEIERQIGQYQQKFKIDFGEKFILHPNELILGSTLEYISLPKDIFAYVLSRSSWGRLGLLIATATAVNPRFKGCLTLELVNLGQVPLTLYPGLPVAQLVLCTASDGIYDGSSSCPVGPEFSSVYKGKKNKAENRFWSNPFGER